MLSVEELYREDVSGKITTISGGKELRGPCPGCEGTDRFGVYPHQNNGRGSYFCGRGKGVGAGCGKGGDAIQYLRDFRGMSYKQACGYLGIEVKGGNSGSMRYIAPKPPCRRNGEHFQPELKQHPEEVVDPAKWREHGMKFVNVCHEALLQRPTSIAYLMARGISRKAIEKYKLGFHHGESRGDQQYLPSFRPWPSWGLASELNDKGKSRKIILPAGLVIPYMPAGFLHRITIRLIKRDPQQPNKKYHYVRGSIRDLWLTNPDAEAFVLQEAEFDCIAVDDAAGDLVGTIGLGSVGMKPDKPTAAALCNAKCILGGLDFDKPKVNEKTGKTELPGGAAGKWWEKRYPQYARWPVPVGKDAGEAFAKGVDLRAWVLAGLPESLWSTDPIQEKEPEQPVAPVENSPAAVTGVRRLRELLFESRGELRIYDQGLSLGVELDERWVAANRDKRAEIRRLLYGSESVANLIENLADGMYSAEQIPG